MAADLSMRGFINIEPCEEYQNRQIKTEPEDLTNHHGFPGIPVPPAAGQFQMPPQQPPPEKPKRGRKRKIKEEPQANGTGSNAVIANAVANVMASTSMPGAGMQIKQETLTGTNGVMKEKKKRDRFKGMSEEEVLKRLLPDHLANDLDIMIIGINPGLCAAFVGHHYAGPGNHFWKCLFLSGLIPSQMNAYDDYKLLEHGIGFTNIVARTSRGSADLSKKEIKEGAEILTEKILKYRPKIAVFNGKGIYEVFCGHKKFHFGKQPEGFPGAPETTVFVMPSSSARCTQLPRAVDKVPFYAALKRYRDYLRGALPKPDDSEVSFPDVTLKTAERKVKIEVKTEDGAAPNMEGAAAGPQAPAPGGTAPKVPKKRGRKPKQAKDQAGANNPEVNGAINLGLERFRYQQGPENLANGSNSNSMSSGRYSDHLTQDRCVSPSVESKVAAWHAANMAHYQAQAMSSSPGVQPQTGATLESLLPQGSVLVKQETPTDLSEYGIPMLGNPCVSTSAPSIPTSSGGHPSMSVPHTTAGYMHPMMYQQMHYQAQAEMNARRSQRH